MVDELELIVSNKTDILNVVPLGPAGIVPPVASFNTVSLLSQKIITQGPDLIIDRALGEYVTLILQNDITSFVVLNWPPLPYLGRIHLDIFNQGSFAIRAWPPGGMSPYGLMTQLTTNGNDLVVLTTADGGATIKISVVGLAYQPLLVPTPFTV